MCIIIFGAVFAHYSPPQTFYHSVGDIVLKLFFYRPQPKPRAKHLSTSSRELVSPLQYETVEEWLTSIKMQKYKDNFQESGCTSIASCLELTADDLTK